jgi:hypothetical protein
MPVCQTTIEPGSFCEKHGTINRHVRMMISTSSPNFGTGPVRAGQQFSETALCDWMARSVDGYAGPLTANGGQSNPRHLLHTPDRSYVLRRKPPSPTLRGSACDRTRISGNFGSCIGQLPRAQSGGAEKWGFRAPERSVLPVREHRSTEYRTLQARMG